MGKILKYMITLILMVIISVMYTIHEESFYTDPKKFALFDSYIKRAADPYEKQLRLAETGKLAKNGTQGKLTVATLKFVDEKYYLKSFSKTYKLLLMREADINNSNFDRIQAGLYLDIDYGAQKEHNIIYVISGVKKNDPYWNVLNSLFDKPVNSVRKKI